MAELAVGHQLAVEQERRADPGAERRQDHHARDVLGHPELRLRHPRRVGVVDHVHRAPQPLGEQRVHVGVDPGGVDVRRRPRHAVLAHRGDGDADDPGAEVVLEVGGDLLDHVRDRVRGRGARGLDLLALTHQRAGREVDRRSLDPGAADVDPEHRSGACHLAHVCLHVANPRHSRHDFDARGPGELRPGAPRRGRPRRRPRLVGPHPECGGHRGRGRGAGPVRRGAARPRGGRRPVGDRPGRAPGGPVVPRLRGRARPRRRCGGGDLGGDRARAHPAGPPRRGAARRPGDVGRGRPLLRRDARRCPARTWCLRHEGRGGREPRRGAHPARRGHPARAAAGRALRDR